MQPVTVLVVDDDPVVRRLVEVVFEMEDHRVLQAPDGPTGLSMAKAHRPDVVLVDAMMPGMDGLQVVSELRGDELTAALPIVMVSAKAQEADVRAGKAAGANEYVTKPFEPLELLDTVTALVMAQPGS